MQLFTYDEIQDIEQLEDGADFRVINVPEYLFTWQPKQEYVNIWVTNNVGVRSMSPEYSFFQYVAKLDIEKELAETLTAEQIAEMVTMFGAELFMLKQNNILPNKYKFQI
jgi:hypothetical protein